LQEAEKIIAEAKEKAIKEKERIASAVKAGVDTYKEKA